MVGKAGLQRELAEVEGLWRNERTFALLHDLTNCIRMADLTKFTEAGPQLVEVKINPTGARSSQRRRIQRALEVINSGAPFRNAHGEQSELVVSSQQFKTRLRELGDGIALAERDGVSSIRLGRQWVVTTLSASSRRLREDTSSTITTRAKALRVRAFEKSGLTHSRHHLQGTRVDRVDGDPSVAPFSIYPFDPATCARLTCDLVAFETVMGWDRLAAAFESVGFSTECPMDEASGPASAEAPVLIARHRKGSITLHGAGMFQILFEMVDPRTYAAAVAEIARGGGNQPSRGVFTFLNERAIWR